MRREFTEDGWRFRVTTRDYGSVMGGNGPTQEVKVAFYDDTLHNPDIEDVHSVKDARVGRREEEVERGVWPFTWTGTKVVKTPDALPDIEEHISDAMDKAWEKIETIEENPSEKVDRALREYDR